MEAIIVGFATAFNFLIIKWKFEKGRIQDAILDIVIFSAIIALTSGSHGGLVAGAIASAIVSLALLKNPPKFKLPKRPGYD